MDTNKNANEVIQGTTSKVKNEVETYKEKYGKVYQVSVAVQPDDFTTVDFEYFFKKPNTASFDRYVKSVSQSSTKALKMFILDNIVEEQSAKIEKDLEEYPALALSVGEKLLNMLGLSKDVNLKLL